MTAVPQIDRDLAELLQAATEFAQYLAIGTVTSSLIKVGDPNSTDFTAVGNPLGLVTYDQVGMHAGVGPST